MPVTLYPENQTITIYTLTVGHVIVIVIILRSIDVDQKRRGYGDVNELACLIDKKTLIEVGSRGWTLP